LSDKSLVDQIIHNAGAVPPPNRTAVETLSGTSAEDAAHRELKPNGQQKDYVVLNAEERARGFVRPVRRSYVHIVCGTATSMPQAIAETYARDPTFYGGTFCVRCGTHFPLVLVGQRQFRWDDGSGVGE